MVPSFIRIHIHITFVSLTIFYNFVLIFFKWLIYADFSYDSYWYNTCGLKIIRRTPRQCERGEEWLLICSLVTLLCPDSPVVRSAWEEGFGVSWTGCVLLSASLTWHCPQELQLSGRKLWRKQMVEKTINSVLEIFKGLNIFYVSKELNRMTILNELIIIIVF